MGLASPLLSGELRALGSLGSVPGTLAPKVGAVLEFEVPYPAPQKLDAGAL